MAFNLMTMNPKNFILLALIVSVIACQAPEDNHTESATAGIEPFYDLSFQQAERDSMLRGLERATRSYKAIHGYLLENSVPPAMGLNPIPVGFNWETGQESVNYGLKSSVDLPSTDEEIAFMSVADLSVLIRAGKLSSTRLTEIYLNRIDRFSDTLQCSITVMREYALDRAAKADAEISSGNYKGPLHGIPFGIKDLLAVEGTKTTWGAEAFKDQEINETATVVKKLEDAGGILTVKLTLGALAMGDVWYGGKTRNPWNLEQGSSGSSAGSASATVAGLIGFSIGTETLGSIVSPSTRCGASGLRPSYGRVSRTGAMALSWSMDKIGPICRTIQDAAIVFDVIRGKDGMDQTLWDSPFNFNGNRNLQDLKVAYIPEYFENSRNKTNDSLSLEVIKGMGVDPVAIELPEDLPISALRIILTAEAAAAFDSLTRSGRDDLLVRQDIGAWPNTFRTARFIPAVEYINANRIRYQLIQDMYAAIKEYDVIITPSYGGSQLLITNLTGNPCAVVPNGFSENGTPTSISFIGNLFDEASILEFAHAYQQASTHEDIHPEYFGGKGRD